MPEVPGQDRQVQRDDRIQRQRSSRLHLASVGRRRHLRKDGRDEREAEEVAACKRTKIVRFTVLARSHPPLSPLPQREGKKSGSPACELREWTRIRIPNSRQLA